MNFRTLTFLFVAVFIVQKTLQAQDTANYLQTRIIADSLEIPWDMHWGPDYKIWFSERSGDIHRLDPNSGEMELIHTIQDVYLSWDNSGLHGFALHPGFPNTPYAYAHYTYRDYQSRLVRLTYDQQSNAFTESVTILDNIPGNISHNGSRIIFDDQGYLFLSTGDAFSGSEVSQDTSSTAGKILRMNADGSVPADNPFGNLVWTLGHRNPQGLVFSDQGILYSSEHGPATDDEVNIIEKGRNYGWADVTGYCDQPSEQNFCNVYNVKEPLTAWTPTEAPCGMAYFNHPAIPEWSHSLLLGFLKQKELKVLHLNASGDSVLAEVPYFNLDFGRIRDVLVLPNGRVFICTSNREANGAGVVKPDDDKIIEIYNPDYDYENIGLEEDVFAARLFPNPASNRLNISLPGTIRGELQGAIFSLQGEKVMHIALNSDLAEGPFSIKVKSLSPGTYLLELEAESGERAWSKFQIIR